MICAGCGIDKVVTWGKPLAPVLCATCVFWAMQGRQTELYATMSDHNLYFLTLNDRDGVQGAPALVGRTEDGRTITSHRWRCLGARRGELIVTVTNVLLSRALPTDPVGLT